MTKKAKLLSHALAVILAVACVQCIALSAFAQDFKLNVKTKENANVDVSGSKITVTDTSFNDDVWNSKALVDTGVTLEPGKQYTVSYTLSGKEGVGEFFLCKGESLDARYSDSFTTGAGSHVITFTAASPKLFLGMQVGNVGSDNSVTADIASINEVAFTNGFTVLKSNNCEVSIEGGKLTVTDTSDNNDVWDSVVLFDAGMKLQVGQPYAVDYMLSGEHGVGEVFMCKSLDLGNRYDTTFANDAGSKHRYFVAQTERVLIGMQVGNIGKGNSVTIEGVNAVYTPVPVSTLVDMAEFDDKVVIRATDNSSEQGIWTSNVLYKLADNLVDGQEYEVSFNIIGDNGVGEVFLNYENNLDWDKHYNKTDDQEHPDYTIYVDQTGIHTMHFKAKGSEAYLGMQMGNIGKGNSVIVEASRPTLYTNSKDAQAGLKWLDRAVAKLTTAPNSTKVAGTTIAVTDTASHEDPENELNKVWTSKVLTFFGNILEHGKTYVAKLKLSVTSAETGEPVADAPMGEFFLMDGTNMDSDRIDNTYTNLKGEQTLVFKADDAPLYAGIQCGNVGEGNTFNVELEELYETPFDQVERWNSFVEITKDNDVILTDPTDGGDNGYQPWDSKVYLNTGLELDNTKVYTVSFDVENTLYGAEIYMCNNASYNRVKSTDANGVVNQWQDDEGGMHERDIFVNEDGSYTFNFTNADELYLVIEGGNMHEGESVTVSNIVVKDSTGAVVSLGEAKDVEYKDVETQEIEMPVITGAVEEALS